MGKKLTTKQQKPIKWVGFFVSTSQLHNPIKGIGDVHARLIHSDGVDGFSDSNLKNIW